MINSLKADITIEIIDINSTKLNKADIIFHAYEVF